jgi:colanic acid/amylovoran biosynthesis glycosyltransferase
VPRGSHEAIATGSDRTPCEAGAVLVPARPGPLAPARRLRDLGAVDVLTPGELTPTAPCAGPAAGPQRRRVCYLLKRYPRLSQTFVLGEMLELERQGVEIVVIARDGSGEAIAHPATRRLRARVYYLRDLEPCEERWDETVAALLRELGVDHVHAHFATWAAGAAMRAAALAGLPYSFTAHATDIYRDGVDGPALVEKMARAAFVVTVSECNRRHLRSLLAASGRDARVLRLYNGLDLERVRPAPAAARRPGLVVAVGRLIEKKGFSDLVEAARLLRARGEDVRTVIVGDGPERPALEAQVDRAGLADRVELVPALPQDEVLELIGSASAFALPCVVGADGDRDGLPTVLLEAMALGTPAVSTTVNGIPEMIENGVSGLLVGQRAPAELADAVARVLGSPELQARLAAGALATMGERFCIRHNVMQLARRFATSAAVAA